MLLRLYGVAGISPRPCAAEQPGRDMGDSDRQLGEIEEVDNKISLGVNRHHSARPAGPSPASPIVSSIMGWSPNFGDAASAVYAKAPPVFPL